MAPSFLNESPITSLLKSLLNVGLAIPVIKEILSTVKNDKDFKEVSEFLESIPGVERLVRSGKGKNDPEDQSA